MVKYQVQFRPINPATKAPMTNTNTWTGTANGIISDKDCILLYKKPSWPTTSVGSPILAADFEKIPHDVWAVYSHADSIKAAMVIAKPLISQYGVQNVQICKVAPASIDIVFQEQQ